MSVHEMTSKCINIDFRFNVPCTLFRQKGAQILCFRGNFYCSVNPKYVTIIMYLGVTSMNDINEYSRVDKYKKRRKNTKALSILLVIGIILLVVVSCIWIFGRDDEVLDDKGSAQNSAVTGKYDEAADEHNEESSDNGISSDMAMDEPD